MDTGAFADDGIYGRCLDTVSEYRRCKVERLRRRDDRNASLAAGILLAHALRECAGIDERLVTYEKNKAGKPFIKDIQFSISHAEGLSLIHISEPTRRTPISYAVFCLKKKKQQTNKTS